MRHIRQSPQYSLAAVCEGVYVIGMKSQLNTFELEASGIFPDISYVVDEVGFVLYERERDPAVARSVDSFGPYFIEQYILMDVLSKQEVAQNVMDYYANHKDRLEECLTKYDETQGKGFICWRFIVNQQK